MTGTKTLIVRKIIPLIAILGCLGGVTASVMEWANSANTYLLSGIFVLVYALAGTAIGFLSVELFNRRGKNIIARNAKNELLIVKQPVYLLTGAAVILAFVTNLGNGSALLASIFYGFSFLLGLSNGMFDYSESVSKNLLIAAVIPIGFSFVYGYYINGSDAASSMAWFFGSVYLLSYLLFVNRMQLNSIIFFRKSVNIEDSKKIRRFNDYLIIMLYVLYLVLFNVRKILNLTYDAIMAAFGWLLVLMEKITDWLIADIDMEAVEEIEREKEKLDYYETPERPWLETLLKIAMYVIIGAIIIAAIISIVVVIIKVIKKIREKLNSNYNKAAQEQGIESEEYVEENSIVRDGENQNRFNTKRKKMKYNLKKLNDIPIPREKIRYVYGFALERLYYKNIKIEESDTPDEILQKIKEYRNGEKLTQMGFEDFTEKYRKARYSYKDIKIEEKLEQTGEKFEKGIASIQVDSKNKFK